MALSAFGRQGYKDSTRKMAAARPKLSVVPSGAERAWGTVDSPPSTSASFLDLRSSDAGPSVPRPSAATSKGKGTAGPPQPNVKKMRRRVALLSGVHLNLPASPVAGPSPPGSSREMAWTFTAEWDSAHDEIVFSDVDGGNSAPTSSSSPNLRFMTSPVPFDVDEDEIFDLDVLSPPPPMTAASPHFSDMDSSSSSSVESSPSSPAVSDIFDFYTHTPSTLSFAHHDDDGFISTAPSSPVDLPSSRELSPPSYAESRYDPPIISVTFYQETVDPARGGTSLIPSASAYDAYTLAYSAFPEKRMRLPTVAPQSRPPVELQHLVRIQGLRSDRFETMYVRKERPRRFERLGSD
ncbi:hypothetical protein ACG7TL_008500 [Trametes sanguinea]